MQGPQGPAAITYYGRVNPGGTIAVQHNMTISHGSTGTYAISLSGNLGQNPSCVRVATPEQNPNASPTADTITINPAGFGGAFGVYVFDHSGTLVDDGFSVEVICG
jgi:hypothetical protein